MTDASKLLPLRSRFYWTLSQKVKKYYDAGHSFTECDAHFGFKQGYSSRRIREAGGTTRKRLDGRPGRGPIEVINLSGERVTLNELGRRLKKSHHVLANWMRRGLFPAHRLPDNRWYILEEEIADLDFAVIELRANLTKCRQKPRHTDPICPYCGVLLGKNPSTNGACDDCQTRFDIIDNKLVPRRDKNGRLSTLAYLPRLDGSDL